MKNPSEKPLTTNTLSSSYVAYHISYMYSPNFRIHWLICQLQKLHKILIYTCSSLIFNYLPMLISQLNYFSTKYYFWLSLHFTCKIWHCWFFSIFISGVVDPVPSGSELFCRIPPRDFPENRHKVIKHWCMKNCYV